MRTILSVVAVSFALALAHGGCSSDTETAGTGVGGGTGGGGWSDAEESWCAAGSGVPGEEAGTRLGPDETHDEVRGGVRLILAYDAQGNSFDGTMENVTTEAVTQARVEVHLSSGTELGPTTPTDLAPSQVVDVALAATEAPFLCWTAHAEVGTEGGGGEGGGEHGGEGGGEHN